MVLGQSFVVADGAPTPVDPGEGPFGRPPAVQDHKGGLPGEFGRDLQREINEGLNVVESWNPG